MKNNERFIKRFADIVGPDRFFDDPEILETYSKDHSFVPPRRPLAVIKPRNTDQIKEIIDLANESLTPIIPISSAFPKFHGDTIPTCPGISVDLTDLNQVLRVDRRNRVAIIEPGVTFGKLREALRDSKMVPYTPLLPRSTKSVLATALEREPITIPKDNWTFSDPIASGEVVIGDGHVQGLGDSAGRSKKEVENGDIIPIYPQGPGAIGLLTMIQGAQGTLGIVSWASVRCRIKPSLEKAFFLAAQDLKDILPFLQKILRPRFVEETFILNAFGLATILSEEAEGIKKLRAALPPWVLLVNVAGYERYPEEAVRWKEEQLKGIAMQEGLGLQAALGGCGADGLLRALEKTADKDRRLRYKNSCQVLPFSTTLDRVPELAACVTRMAGEYGYSSADLSIYIQPVIQGCMCYCEIVFPYNPGDKQEVESAKNLFMASAQRMSHIGAYYSRPYGALADITYKDTEVVNVLRKIKRIFDPNDIMNSGKLC